MTLQQLKYFRMMADVLHYTQAAKLLYISQSSLSYSLSELEKELGAPLFAKQGKKTVLTQYGMEFLPFAKDALNSIEEGTRRIEKMLLPGSVINLGYIYSLSFNYLPRVLTGFRNLEGNGETSFNFYQGLSSLILEKLKNGELDLALSVDQGDPDVFSSVAIHEQKLYLVVPRGHRLTHKEYVFMDDLREENFISISPHSSLRKQLDGIFETIHASPKVTFEAEECNAMASFVSERFGIAIMPEIPALQAYNVEVLPIVDRDLKRQVFMLWVKDRPLSPIADSFREYLIKNIEEPQS